MYFTCTLHASYLAWTLGQYEREKLGLVEVCMWEKTTKANLVERKTNGQALQDVKRLYTLNILETLMKRKIKLIEDGMKDNIFMKNIFEGKISESELKAGQDYATSKMSIEKRI